MAVHLNCPCELRSLGLLSRIYSIYHSIMPRPAGKARDAVADELASFKSDKKNEPQKINLGDGASLKRALDDAATAVLQEQGWVEDLTLSNIKIGGGLFTCILAAIAQFYPKKYPENFWVLLVCVALYIISTLALNVVLSGIEGDIFFTSKSKGGVTLCLSSQLPRFSEQYKLCLGRKTSRWRKALVSPTVELSDSVTEYFDNTGLLVEGIFKAAVAAKLKAFAEQQKKYR